MSKNLHEPKSENLQIAKITAIQAIVVAVITVLGTGVAGYFVGKMQESPVQKPPSDGLSSQSVEFITHVELQKLIEEAQSQILATGYVLTSIDPNKLADKVRKSDTFKAQIVIHNPLSKKKIICQRDEDERKTTPRTYVDLVQKIQRFNEARRELPEKRFQVLLSEMYPTIAVFIIDNNLCVYFYPYAEPGTQSPVIKFSNYTTNESAKFFLKHYNSVLDNAMLLTDSEYRRFATIPANPCAGKSIK